MFTTAEKATIWTIVALLTSPAWLFILACIYEQATAEPSAYPYTGFCPDCPEHIDSAEF